MALQLTWREKTGGVIAPDERLPWGQTVALGLQHVLAMFGATVVAPLVMGFDPNLAIFFSGIGTLIFFIFVGGRVPSYLGSSFSFIGPIAAAIGSPAAGNFNPADIPKALGGIIAAGLLYTIIGLIVHISGTAWIDRLMPPIVTGSVVMIIGLNLAPAAWGLVQQGPFLAIVTLFAVLIVGLYTRGIWARLPVLLGTIIGYVVALILGGTSPAGREIWFFRVQGVDLSAVREAAWFGLPDFVGPSFDTRAVTLVAPVAIVLVAENFGHIKAVEAMTSRNMTQYLGRAFMGDGVATMVAGTGGGTGVTTYAENIGVMAMTRVYSTIIFPIAALVAILLGLSPKFGALVQSIPAGVLGGITTVLFGLIAVTGGRIWVEGGVDFTKGINLFIAAVALILGAADYKLRLGDFEFAGIALGTFGAIILYQLFKGAPQAFGEFEAAPAEAGAVEPGPGVEPEPRRQSETGGQ
ncbi:Putative pyrimidine permease RutG [bacterium HR26]|nr:Putative pyrimidine permease RutG [bacterium HR26]